MWVHYNPNPTGRSVDDCSIRAVAKALDIDWETAYILITSNGLEMGDMPHADSVWGSVLRERGFYRKTIPNSCPDCYSIKAFARDNPRGVYVLGTGTHVATVENGNIYDAWDRLHRTFRPLVFLRDRLQKLMRFIIASTSALSELLPYTAELPFSLATMDADATRVVVDFEEV